MNVTVRDLDETVYRRFKARAVEEGMKLGEALTQAMEMWVKQRVADKRSVRFMDIKPFNWGVGTEKTSVEVDQVLYGERP